MANIFSALHMPCIFSCLSTPIAKILGSLLGLWYENQHDHWTTCYWIHSCCTYKGSIHEKTKQCLKQWWTRVLCAGTCNLDTSPCCHLYVPGYQMYSVSTLTVVRIIANSALLKSVNWDCWKKHRIKDQGCNRSTYDRALGEHHVNTLSILWDCNIIIYQSPILLCTLTKHYLQQ